MTIKKEYFQGIVKQYCEGRRRLSAIKKGDLVWEVVSKHIDLDYHPAVVMRVNIDECFVDVIDVTMDNKEKRYSSSIFLTEKELSGKPGMSEEIISNEYIEYGEIIRGVVQNDN